MTAQGEAAVPIEEGDSSNLSMNIPSADHIYKLKFRLLH
jgi:hypothetical protein